MSISGIHRPSIFKYVYSIRMIFMSSFEKVKKFLERLKDENIKFKKHFYDRIKERPITEVLVRKYLKKPDKLLQIEELPARTPQEEKYKLWLELSHKYSLVIVAVISMEDLYIVTAWNTYKKWQKQILK